MMSHFKAKMHRILLPASIRPSVHLYLTRSTSRSDVDTADVVGALRPCVSVRSSVLDGV